MKISMCVAVGALAAALAVGGSSRAHADEPSTRPAQARLRTRPRRQARAAGLAMVILGLILGATLAITGRGTTDFRALRDWEDMMNFINANAPNRARVLNDISQQPERGLRRRLIQKWHAYNYMQDRSRRWPISMSFRHAPSKTTFSA